MKVVIDTNVLVSAVFFGGVPGKIIGFWRDGLIELIVTNEILAEYIDVLRRLHARYSKVDPNPIVSLIIRKGTFVQSVSLKYPVSCHHKDDKFFAAALGAGANVIVSGDIDILKSTGYQGLSVITPAQLVEFFS